MLKLFLRNIKKGFATNSSSYHSTMIFTGEEYEKWKKGIFEHEIPYEAFDSEEYYHNNGIYCYVESESKREIDGQIIIAITYCETNEW